MMNFESTHVRAFPFWISQYLWVAIVLIFLLIGVIVTPYQKIKPIKSLNSTFSADSLSNSPPVLIMHLTDIHLNSYLHIRAQTFERALSFAAKNNISKLINSGDLVDNKKYELSYGVQSKTDYPHYSSEMEKFMKKKTTNKKASKSIEKKYIDSEDFFEDDSIFDIPGNHDEYGVPSFTSDIHRILDFSKYFQYLAKSGNSKIINSLSDVKSERINLSTFWASRADITDNIEIVSINPFRHPTPHAKLGFWNHPTTAILDDLEKVLMTTKKATKSNAFNERTLFVQCHFPVKVMITRQKTSKSRLSMSQLFEKYGVDLVLTGHLHPKDPSLLHTDNGVLEIVGSDLKGHKGLGIISVDKGNRIFYHSEHFDDIQTENLEGMPNCLVINPIPTEQLSLTSSFNDKNLEIRVICFTKSKEIILHSKIESNSKSLYEKDLTFDHFLSENQALYVANIDLEEFGSYTLKITSENFDLTTSKKTKNRNLIQFDFYVGDEVTIKKEKIYCYPNLVDTCFSGLVIFFVINVIITFPIHFMSTSNHGLNPENLVDDGVSGTKNSGIESSSSSSMSCKNYFVKMIEDTHNWIIGISDERKIIPLIFLGPLLVRRRISMLHIGIQILLFVVSVWPLCLPLIFMTIEGKFAMIWMYGYVCDGKSFFDVFGFIFAFLFEVFLVTPTVLTFSMLTVSTPFKCSFMYFDLAVYAVCTIFLLFLDYYFVYEASYFGGCFTSPEFFVFPLTFIVFIIVILFKKRKVINEETTTAANDGYPNLS